ncbi:DUF6702 family protein [Flagellimonas meridianipacifica]|uniref:Peptidase E n=1 Tax=Flagellimonas meridianipacifica TaxID=1080225 RepID=A0A2T0M6C7_9FLAO|nr:DUF6702 family protein [Allomuricauda pacifica]PRX53049.1 hypothetical protein CLV81_3950 [Allomuricauda pacifica]
MRTSVRNSLFVLTVFAFLSFSVAHKFYVSVTHVKYSEKDTAFQITSRVFIDDLEDLLSERFGVTAKLATNDELENANTYIKRYFLQKFVVEINGEKVDYDFLGKTYDNDVVILYLEIPNIQLSETKSIAIQNEILTDLFDEQQNIVHFKWKGQKKSFVLIRENNKGMLNL